MRPILLLISLLLPGCSGHLQPFEYGCIRMGARARVVIYAEDPAQAAAGARAAFAQMAVVEAALSDWQIDSPVARLRAAAVETWIEVDPIIDEALRVAAAVTAVTGGAFDPACGRMSAAWRVARREGRMAEDWEDWTAQHGPGASRLWLQPGRLRFGDPVPWLDFGGIGKGFAADRALAALASRGCGAALVDIGGELALGAPPPNERGWRVARPDGRAGGGRDLLLSNCGVATSGAGEQMLQGHQGTVASHVIDPRSGRWLGGHETITVVAPTAAEADALASAGCVLGAAVLREVVRRPDVQIY